MYVRIISMILVISLLSACQMFIDPPAPVQDRYGLDEPIVFAVGESTKIEDSVHLSTIELTFVGVREDTRCPDSRTVDVMCTWSGAVEVEMTATVIEQQESFSLIGITDYDGVVEGSLDAETDSTIRYFAGYDFVLVQVTPYPGDERPQPEEYVATVIVRRAAEPLPTPTAPSATIEHLIDDTGLPLLCISEKAMVEWAAGAIEGEPVSFTPPLASESLESRKMADEICILVNGNEWRAADVEEVEGMWATLIPTDVSYWVWDYQIDAVAER
jgi:hypothetical protein